MHIWTTSLNLIIQISYCVPFRINTQHKQTNTDDESVKSFLLNFLLKFCENYFLESHFVIDKTSLIRNLLKI